MQSNNLKQRLASGEVLVGCLLAYDAPWLVEVLGLAGYDFVTVDLEHEPFDDSAVANLIRAADGVGLPTIVRMACTDRVVPFLTAGVHGVQVPDIRGRQHGEELVELTRFPPLGRRTYYSQTRGARYGVGIDETAWREEADDRLLLIGTIEDIAVVEQLDDLLQVAGIDAFHVGPLDLAQSMGNPPRSELERVIEGVVERCRAAGKYVAVGAVTPWGIEGVRKWVDEGAQIFNVASAFLLTDAVAQFLKQVEERIPGDRRVSTAVARSQNPYLAPEKDARDG